MPVATMSRFAPSTSPIRSGIARWRPGGLAPLAARFRRGFLLAHPTLWGRSLLAGEPSGTRNTTGHAAGSPPRRVKGSLRGIPRPLEEGLRLSGRGLPSRVRLASRIRADRRRWRMIQPVPGGIGRTLQRRASRALSRESLTSVAKGVCGASLRSAPPMSRCCPLILLNRQRSEAHTLRRRGPGPSRLPPCESGFDT